MGIWAGQGSWPSEPGDNVDPLEQFAASISEPARWLPDWVVLGLLLGTTILFALVHPS